MVRYVLAKATYSKIVLKYLHVLFIAWGSRSRGDHRYIRPGFTVRFQEYRVGFNLNHIISEQVQIPSLASRRKLASIKFLSDVFNCSVDCPYLLSQFSIRIPSFSCRKHDTFYLDTARTNLLQYSSLYQMVKNYSDVEGKLDVFCTNWQEIRALSSYTT
jgi:hypothetical protein